ncbi:hypothetical protein LDL08_33320 [Nonomuraea glycinis]|uniref:Transposase n=1 Tax=Nonomuraea glycinis TaxID=2047744 RepID=A0A918AGE3_9ACTN|nr:hypothetical protein [Nonomuraea glycinis]MCA2181068.1 hypothetical protein [Nonomuraea glycinis]GGP18512.1 hypothetical protein GCM10012278_91000 [Nonomuraea glycinis]
MANSSRVMMRSSSSWRRHLGRRTPSHGFAPISRSRTAERITPDSRRWHSITVAGERRLACEQDTNGGELAESEREELARLRRQRAEWAKERAELEMERDVLKRSVVLWVREAMGR